MCFSLKFVDELIQLNAIKAATIHGKKNGKLSGFANSCVSLS